MKARKINLLNIFIIVTVVLCIIGTLLAINNKTPLNKVIKGKENIAIEVFIQDTLTKESNVFKIGDETSLIIRNQPLKKLELIKLEEREKPFISFDRTGTYKITPDTAINNYLDYIITLTSEAIITNDGYVVEGTKIKIGNQVILEGFNYRLNGRVTNIYPTKASE